MKIEVQIQELPDVPRNADGRPMGTKCRPTCRAPIGRAQTHCTVCHSTLRTVGDFDRHRRDGWCLDLPSLGLVESDGLWATPEGHVQGDAKRDILARNRQSE